MTFLDTLPVPLLALLIFLLRIVDVSLGTMRTISVIQGRIPLAVGLGFIEVLVWITAVAQTITSIRTSPMLLLAFPAGFAAGNAVGIALERRISLGWSVLRIITAGTGSALVARLGELGRDVTTFAGVGPDGPRTLIYTTARRRDVPDLLASLRAIDPGLYFAADRYSETSDAVLPHATGWRAFLKMK